MRFQLNDFVLQQPPRIGLSPASDDIAAPPRGSRCVARRVPSTASLRLVEEAGEGGAARTFIADRFYERFGALVPSLMPRLFTLRDDDDTVLGAVGLRHGDRDLYLEQYLRAPIDQAIARHAGRPCDRGDVVEVGHLCGAFPGVVRTMIDLVTRHIDREERRWVAFTGTTGLRNAFLRLGLVPIDIGAAHAEALPVAERTAWGRYYDDAPRVYIGSVRLGTTHLGLQPTHDVRGPRR